ncbi:MAG: FAD-dependent thymidylate synthase [Clostridiaceae bacterium]|jgi:thymidylate synthase (FAD)|nr:FAD-dependent thymidylate synthase [Clostridiaceae bacterium]
MKIIKPHFEILTRVDGMEVLKMLELAGRTCYKSEDRITDISAVDFVRMILSRGHESVIEHFSITAKIVCDRGVSHEIVRHRIASYAQESTRYCNYSKSKFGSQLTFIQPSWCSVDWTEYSPEELDDILRDEPVVPDHIWLKAMKAAETYYFQLLEAGRSPEEARAVLPNSLKTEIVMTTNLREWRHFFRMRTSAASHPQMREIAVPLLKAFKDMIPVVFDDIDPGE